MATPNTAAETSVEANPGNEKAHIYQGPPFLTKVTLGAQMYGLQGFLRPMLWFRGWKEYFYPPDGGPDIVKTYECRPYHPARIFFPASYDQTSPHTLPTVFSVHGGGFCIGEARDDDVWNRAFADSQGVLVIAFEYSKAPWAPFPTGLHDIEAVLLAVLADESLPIARAGGDADTKPAHGSASETPDPKSTGTSRNTRSRTAILGFSAGGNLALTVSQLPSVHSHPDAPRAAISMYGVMDLSTPPAAKAMNRPYKPALPPARNGSSDILISMAPAFDWSYIPYGQDLSDPLLSPVFAAPASLPPFVGLVGAELDMLAHESWRLACRLGKRDLPDRESQDAKLRLCGREEVADTGAALEMADERFAFEESWEGEDGEKHGVKWLLVPDVLHGFDNKAFREILGNEETIKDAEMKTKAYLEEVGRWLKETVWELGS